MLILERFKEQRVIITTARGERIEIMVTEFVRRGQKLAVKLGIKAPKEMAIFREELSDVFSRRDLS